jgi:hypothetical protein
VPVNSKNTVLLERVVSKMVLIALVLLITGGSFNAELNIRVSTRHCDVAA